MRVLHLILFLFITMAFWSCKDKDEIPPNIIFITPTENTQFNIREQIVVEANVSDNDIVERVTFRMVTEENNISVAGSATVFPNEKDANVKGVLQINDTLLDGGRYFIEIEASDGENEFSTFRAIRIEGIPRRRLSTVVTTSNGSRTNVFESSSDSTFQLVNNYPYAFKASQLNNEDQHFWFVPQNHNEIFVQNVKDNLQVYSKQYNSNFSDPFVDLCRLDRVVYLGVQQEIDGISERFSDKFTELLSTDRKLTSLSVGDDYLISSETDLQGNNGMLKIFNVNSPAGIAINSISIPYDVKKAFVYGGDRGVVFYNSDVLGNYIGAVGHFEVSKNGIREVEFTGGPIQQVIQVTSNEYLIATDAMILLYRVSTENAFVYDFAHFPVLHYDETSNELFVGTSRELRVYDYPSSNFNVMTTFSNDIKSIAVRYNKN